MKHIIWLGGLACAVAGCEQDPEPQAEPGLPAACGVPAPERLPVGACMRAPADPPADGVALTITATGEGVVDDCFDRLGTVSPSARWFTGTDADDAEWTFAFDLPATVDFAVGETVTVFGRVERTAGFAVDLVGGYFAVSDADGLRALVLAGQHGMADFASTLPGEVALERGPAICLREVECGYTVYGVEARVGEAVAAVDPGTTAQVAAFTVVNAAVLAYPINQVNSSCNAAPEDFALGAWRTE